MDMNKKILGRIEENRRCHHNTCCGFIVGPTGPTGPTGPISLGVFAYLYNLAVVGTQIIAPGAAMTFSNNGPIQGVTHIPGSADITIDEPGTYQIDYFLSPSTFTGNPTVAITINDIVEPSSNVTFSVTFVAGSTTINLATGDVINFINNSANSITLRLSPDVSIQFNVTKID